MKGLILSGGKGTRLRPITHTSAKQLIPIANKPILFYALENFQEAGIKNIGIIVGDTHQEIKEALGNGERWKVNLHYIHQSAPLGLAHAVKIAQDYLQDEPFVMFLGDNLIKDGIKDFVKKFRKSRPNALILLTKVEEPQLFGVAELKNGKVVRLMEKPKVPPSNLALVGIYIFDKNIFTAANKIKPSFRDELEITDAIQYLIDKKFVVEPHIVQGWWKDTGKLTDLLEANCLILEDLEQKIEGKVDKNSQISGKVVIEKDAEIINSIIRGPAIIGKGCKIVNSYIGPFTSIYYEALVENSEVEHSIVLECSKIIDLGSRLENSLIGKNVTVYKNKSKPKAYQLMLGDSSEVGVI